MKLKNFLELRKIKRLGKLDTMWTNYRSPICFHIFLVKPSVLVLLRI